MQDEGADALHRPVVVVGAEVGDLDGDVPGPREGGHAVAPSLDAVRVAVGGAAGVVEKDRRVREGTGERERIAQLPGIDHQVEGEIVFAQQAEASPPGGIPHEVGAVREGPDRVAVPAHDLADAADVGVGPQRLQDGLDPRLGEGGEGDDPVREAVFVGDPLEPARFAERIVEARLNVDRLDGRDPGHVRQIVGNPIVAHQRRGVAEDRLARLSGQPRIAAGAERPEMMMRIDDRAVIESAHAPSPRPPRPRCAHGPAGESRRRLPRCGRRARPIGCHDPCRRGTTEHDADRR